MTNYWYDADGERTVKTSGEGEQLYVNSEFAGGRTNTAKFSLYVSPYLVANQGGRYTKHIYIGSQRIVSKIGDFASYGSDPRRIQYAGSETDGLSVNYKQKYSAQQQVIKDNYAIFEVPYNGTDNNDYVDGQGFCCDDGSPEAAQARALALENNFQDPDAYEKLQFYYHPDHLGSSSYITNLDGEVVQHIEYVPFGEVFMEERNNIWNTPYLFNAKEFDEETGLYYYGARYYDSRLSLWISTDPLQEKYVNITSYCYTYNNPVIFIDPDGRHVEVTKSKDGSYEVSGGKANKDQNIYENYGLKNQRVIGKMLTQYSFMNDDGNAIKGSIIDLSDKSGEEFLSDFMNNTPSLIDYMPNAIGGEKYDFKRNGTEYGDNNYNNSLYHHRGMIVSIDNKKYIASARDIGNFAAGYIAGKNDLSWAIARLGFDLLETKQHMSKGEFGFFKEGNPTRYAEKAGFDVGRMTDIAKAIRKAKLYRSMYPPRIW